MQEGNAYNELIQAYNENKLSHAFLIETNHEEKCFEAVIHFLKVINCPEEYNESCSACNLCHLFDSFNLPSLVVIEPDGTMIKKEQILSLKEVFQTKPVYTKYNMYIVKEAEALNPSSANTMLKFLEEPEENIIGFFITNNKENIIDTIRSRCQIIKDIYSEDYLETIPSVWKEMAKKYLIEIEEHQEEAVFYNKDVLLPLIHDRKELNYLFQSILNIYYDAYQKCLNHESMDDLELNFLYNKGRIYLQKRISMVTKLLDKLNYNLNISLVLDCFVLEGSDIS